MTEDKKKVVEFKKQAYEVKTQAPTITEEALNEAKKVFGVDFRMGRATLEITKDTVKEQCGMIDWINQLFLDEEYAKKSRWGGVIAPPTMVGNPTRGIGEWGLRGVQSYHCGDDWEWFQVIRPGDILTERMRPVELIERSGRTASRMVEQVVKKEIRNQRGELVCLNWFHIMRVARASSGSSEGLHYEARQQKWTDEELQKIEAEIDSQKIRGALPRFWEDTKEGEEMEPIVLGPLRNVEIALCGGRPGDETDRGGSFVFQILRRRKHPAETYVDPKTGAQDHPHRGHWDNWMAREIGMPGRYDTGPTRTPLVARFAFDWMGDDAFLKKAWATLRRPRLVADVAWCRGKVVRKWIEGNEHLVQCEINLFNQLGDTIVTGKAEVSLPSRLTGQPPLPVAPY